MRRALFLISATISLIGVHHAATALGQPDEQSARAQPNQAEIVQEAINAHRARNLDRFMATFASDAVVIANGMTARGLREIRALYASNFAPDAPELIVVDSGVSEGQIWTSTGFVFRNGGELCCFLSRYTIEDGLVKRLVVTPV